MNEIIIFILSLFLLITPAIAGDDFGGSFNEFGPTWAYELWVSDPYNLFTTTASPPSVQSALTDLVNGYSGVWTHSGTYIYPTTITDSLGIATSSPAGIFQAGTGGGGLTVLSSGNVGIGTTAPTNRLEINSSDTNCVYITNSQALGSTAGAGILATAIGTPSAANQRLSYFLAGAFIAGSSRNATAIESFSDGAWAVGTSRPTYINFSTVPVNSITRVERMRINNTGNVGIGTTNPLATLAVKSNADQIGYRQTDNATQTSLRSLWESNTGTNQVSIDANGNVGVGTTAPGSKLHIFGAKSIFEVDGVGIQSVFENRNFQAAAADVGSRFSFVGIGEVGQANIVGAWNGAATTDAYLSFTTRKSNVLTEQVRITSTGNVGIGTTNPLGLLVAGTNQGTPGLFVSAGAANVGIGRTAPTANLQVIGTVKIGTTGNQAVLCITTSGQIGTCDTAGTCATCTGLTGS